MMLLCIQIQKRTTGIVRPMFDRFASVLALPEQGDQWYVNPTPCRKLMHMPSAYRLMQQNTVRGWTCSAAVTHDVRLGKGQTYLVPTGVKIASSWPRSSNPPHVLDSPRNKALQYQQSWNHRRRLPWWDQSNSHQRTNRFYHYERWTNRTNGRRQVWSHESIPGSMDRQDFRGVGGFGSTGA
jgi:hypothetical protein